MGEQWKRKEKKEGGDEIWKSEWEGREERNATRRRKGREKGRKGRKET